MAIPDLLATRGPFAGRSRRDGDGSRRHRRSRAPGRPPAAGATVRCLVGPPGAGATTLALEEAAAVHRSGRPVWWLRGSDEATLQLDLLLATEGPAGRPDGAATPVTARAVDQPGLVVVDGLTEPELLAPYLSGWSEAAVLVTTSSDGARRLGPLRRVAPLDGRAVERLVAGRLGRAAAHQLAPRLAACFEGRPLGLQLGAAALARLGCDDRRRGRGRGRRLPGRGGVGAVAADGRRGGRGRHAGSAGRSGPPAPGRARRARGDRAAPRRAGRPRRRRCRAGPAGRCRAGARRSRPRAPRMAACAPGGSRGGRAGPLPARARRAQWRSRTPPGCWTGSAGSLAWLSWTGSAGTPLGRTGPGPATSSTPGRSAMRATGCPPSTAWPLPSARPGAPCPRARRVVEGALIRLGPQLPARLVLPLHEARARLVALELSPADVAAWPVRRELATTRVNAGQAERAVAEFESLVTELEVALGPSSPRDAAGPLRPRRRPPRGGPRRRAPRPSSIAPWPASPPPAAGRTRPRSGRSATGPRRRWRPGGPTRRWTTWWIWAPAPDARLGAAGPKGLGGGPWPGRPRSGGGIRGGGRRRGRPGGPGSGAGRGPPGRRPARPGPRGAGRPRRHRRGAGRTATPSGPADPTPPGLGAAAAGSGRRGRHHPRSRGPPTRPSLRAHSADVAGGLVRADGGPATPPTGRPMPRRLAERLVPRCRDALGPGHALTLGVAARLGLARLQRQQPAAAVELLGPLVDDAAASAGGCPGHPWPRSARCWRKPSPPPERPASQVRRRARPPWPG